MPRPILGAAVVDLACSPLADLHAGLIWMQWSLEVHGRL
jgi:hypothetical protein